MPTLNWIGKEKVINHHQEVPFKTLKKEYTFNADESGNMIIHGDNLVALKSLLPQYEGKIDCIYIDPPYNTGNEGWVYNDNVNHPQIQKWLGEVVGSEGEDLSRHDKWLCMMYPRLKLLKKFMNQKGFFFCSIDDNEYQNLKYLCDEIFGARNHVCTFVWEKIHTRKNNSKNISNKHEYVLFYCANIDDVEIKPVERTLETLKGYKNTDNDPRGLWTRGSMLSPKYTEKNDYVLTFPNGKTYTLKRGVSWRYKPEKMMELANDNRVLYEPNMPREKRFLSEAGEGMVPESLLLADEVGHTQMGTEEVRDIFGKKLFDYPKPTKLIKWIIDRCKNKDAIILDAFAGSGTTAHAVLKLNKEDGGDRKFIEIEMMDYAETIVAERVRKVISGYAGVDGTGGSFSFYELGESLFDKEGNLNPNLNIEDIRKFIFYTETQQEPVDKNSDFLGALNDTGYYLNYKKDEETCLNLTYLKSIDRKFGYYVIYADTCTLSGEQLEKYHIIFKKIPRDILKY